MPQYISNKIAVNDISDEEVFYAIRQDIKDALEYRFSLIERESNEWFYLAKKLAQADKEIAFDLATIYHVEGDNTQAIYWYKKAAFLNHDKALSELINLYIEDGELLLAKELLLPVIDKGEFLEQLIEVSISLGDISLVNRLISSIENKPQSKLLSDIKKFQINHFKKKKQSIEIDAEHQTPDSKLSAAQSCPNNIQLFATNLNNLYKLESLVNEVEDHPISNFLCFETPRYISSEKLSCNFDENKAIRCNEQIWSTFEPEIKTRYLGLMLNKGGANVDNGIMYLDSFDDKNVFIHELSHLLGFIDEYPLPKNHKVCQQPQANSFSYNVSILKPFYEGSKDEVLSTIEKQIPWFSFINKNTPILEKVGNKWKVGTPKSYLTNKNQIVGLFEAETCNTKNVKAFMPTNIKTKLRYYEEALIPLYIDFLKINPDDYLMPSYHYNIAKSLFKNNEEKLGLYWLNKALVKDKSGDEVFKNQHHQNRYKKMMLGEY